MKTLLFIALLVSTTWTSYAQLSDNSELTGVHAFSMTNIDGDEIALSTYAGDVLLIVNTASKCGFTPQYAPLEQLYRTYKDKGFRVLAFPANNFGAQEPGSNEEIKAFCETNYDVSFDLFAKISVRGEDIHPLYSYLTEQADFTGDIKWNFTKFLVDATGKVVARFETRVDPMSDGITGAIEEMLSKR